MTFVVHWRRDGTPPAPALVDRLAGGLTRLRDDPVTTWSRGAFTVLAFEDSPGLSMFESPAGFVSVLSGRLDDLPNLVARLGGDLAGKAPTDAEVLGAAFERWGADCFERLVGDFAAVIWEESRKSLVCARDVVGIAPLYHWGSAQEVVLSGHLGGVVSHPSVTKEPNEGYIAEILSDAIHSRHETLYVDVSRLVAGHAARYYETGFPKIWEWGRIDPLEMSPHLRDEEYDEQYRALLTEAIGDRMRGQVRVGVELSGGLDSSSVAVLAAPLVQKLAADALHSYSLTFPGMACDETPYIETVAASAGLEATLLPRQPLDMTRLSRDVEATHDLPAPPNATAWRALHAMVADHGLGALLSGEGGDQWFEAVSHYPAELLAQGKVFSAWRASKQLSEGGSGLRAVYAGALRPALGDLARRSGLKTARPKPTPPWITDALAARTSLSDRLSDASGARSVQAQRMGLVTQGWEAFAHEMQALEGERTGVLTRYPFYDVRLIAFALGLDERHRWGAGYPRTIQRRSMRGYLPEVVRDRTVKADFSAVFVEEMDQIGSRDWFDDLYVATGRDWVRSEQLRGRYDDLVRTVRSGGKPHNMWPLWLVLSVDCCFRSERMGSLSG